MCSLRTHSTKLVRASLPRNYTNWRPSYSAASSVFHFEVPSQQNLSSCEHHNRLCSTMRSAYLQCSGVELAPKPCVSWGILTVHQISSYMVFQHQTWGERWNIVPNLNVTPAHIPSWERYPPFSCLQPNCKSPFWWNTGIWSQHETRCKCPWDAAWTWRWFVYYPTEVCKQKVRFVSSPLISTDIKEMFLPLLPN